MSSKHMECAVDLEYLFAISPDLICVVGYDGYFKKVNLAVSKTLKYSEEELLSTPVLSFIHPDDRERTSCLREELKKQTEFTNFENRYISKDGETVWLSWSSIGIEAKEMIFAIGKDVTTKKKEKDFRISAGILKNLSLQNKITFLKELREQASNTYSAADGAWLHKFENLVRKYTGKIELNLRILGDEMAIGERQMFRKIKCLTGMTPNQYIRLIRLQIALEAIQTGKYTTISEVSYAAGFQTPAYFKKLFKQEYHLDIEELL